MTKRMKGSSRVLSFVVALCLIVSMLPMMAPTADAAYISTNAPAATEQMLKTYENTYAVTQSGGVLRVIDGELWVWGNNYRFGLGLDKYNNKTTDGTTVVTEPVKLDFDFGSPIVKVVASFYDSVAVLTESGDVYTWGSYIWKFIFDDSGTEDPTNNQGRTPMKWDTTNITAIDEVKNPDGDRKIVDIQFNSIAIYAMDSNGETWIAGTTNKTWAPVHMAENLTSDSNMKFRPVAKSFIDKLQDSYNKETGEVENETQKEGGAKRRTVEKMIISHFGGTVFIYTREADGSEGPFFAIGQNNGGHNLIPNNPDGSYWRDSTMPIKVLEGEFGKPLVDAGVDMNTLYTSGYNTSFIDPKGNVWMVGSNKTSLYPSDDDIRMPTKVYDADFNTAKAIKVFASGDIAVFLTNDNSLYAIGKNQNKFIDSNKGEGVAIEDYTQVFTELSKTDTIAGVYPTSYGVMVVTESGDQYWTGSNAYGTMGNGTTESPAPGTYTEASQPSLPPVMPASDNKIIFEIEDPDGNTYVSAVDEDGTEYILKNRTPEGGGTKLDGSTDETMAIEAGKIFKVNVYFEDMARLKSWVVPIRFNPSFVKVVNGNGVAYAEDAVITPGAYGESVGITKGFASQDWAGGILIGDQGASGTWPKICNTDGWVSVAGYTSDTKASISGEQLMFSVYFMAMETYNPGSYENMSLFDIADMNNINKYITAPTCSDGYDKGGIINQNYGPGWVVSNTESDDDVGNYGFNYVPHEDYYFPVFPTTSVDLTKIELHLFQSDGTTEVQKVSNEPVYVGGTSKPYSGYAINNKNTSEIYTLKVKAIPDEASFPQVNWSKALVSHNDGITQLGDYVTILEEQETYVRFKLPDNFSMEESGVVTFTAVTKKKTTTNNDYYTATENVIIKTFKAPETIEIVAPNIVDGEVIYTAVDDTAENKTFTVDFPGAADGFPNLAVAWKVLDKNGNQITDSTANAALKLGTPIAAGGDGGYNVSDYSAPQVSVDPVHTTHGSDFVVLRAESLYDPSVFDEVIIKIHLKATELKFKQTELRLPTNSSRDLMSLLQIAPENDYYEVNLVWSYTPTADENPDDGITRYLSAGNSSIISSGSTPTPKKAGSDTFETIHVKDTISNKEATLKVAVINLNSPIKPEQIEVQNVLGDLGDLVDIKSGLELGDTIRFYKTYETEYSTENIQNGSVIEYKNLGNAQVPDYKFTVQKFLESAGGEIAVTVSRNTTPGDDSTFTEYDRIPVAYDPEPSKVYGYVSLAGKDANSARNAGIAIQLTGLSTPDIVYTDSRGYFEFDTYIQPGTYTLSIYQDNYLKRTIKPDDATGYAGLVIPSLAEFAISTEDNPIVLYPGDINADGAITATDINYYVRNWVGQTSTALEKFANYDFYDDSIQVINLNDLDMVTRRIGWVRESYAKWYVPTQK